MLEGNGIVRAGCGKPARPVRRGRTDRAIGPVSSLLYWRHLFAFSLRL